MRINRKITTDILIVGGGISGVSAALSASADPDKKVMLVEKYGFLGGTSTMVLDTFNGFYIPGENQTKVVAGNGDIFVEELQKRNACFDRQNTYGSGKVITYNQEELKTIYEELLTNRNVDIMLHSILIDAECVDGKVNKVIVANKKEVVEIEAAVYIDCSGDADLAYKAGFECMGVDKNEEVQSLTTTFKVANIDEEKAKTFTKKDMWKWMKEANDSGNFNLPRLEGSLHETTFKNTVATNMVRIHLSDPTDIEQISKAEIEGRQQSREYYRFMKTYLPGYENSELIALSTQIGVRETRRVIGEYVLTYEDVKNAKKFEDGILLCGSPVEDHNATSGTKWVYMEEDQVYHIPYRSLIPKNATNLLIAGRCFSSEHTAHSSSRSAAQCLAMGQAAGTAAKIAATTNTDVKEINTRELLDDLRNQNALLEL